MKCIVEVCYSSTPCTYYNKSPHELVTQYIANITLRVHHGTLSIMKEELLPINLLRFLAALGVLFVHSFPPLISAGYLPQFLSFLVSYTQYGYLGVPLFFIISGFVITLSSEGRTFSQFVSARFIRLFPVFWICVSITSLVVFFMKNSDHFSWMQYFANLTMVPHFFGNYGLIDGPYWSLECELKFYFFIAIILLLRPIISIHLQKVAIILAPLLLSYAVFYNPYHGSFRQDTLEYIFYLFSEENAQYFLSGILFYGIYKNRKSYYTFIALIIYYIVAILQALDHTYPKDKPEVIIFYITLFFVVFLAISLKKITNTSLSFLGKNNRGHLSPLVPSPTHCIFYIVK